MPKGGSRSIDKGIGARLKLYRQRAGLSQTTLGKHLGVTFQQVQKYENGCNRLSAGRLLKVVSLLGISIADLLTPETRPLRTDRREDAARFLKSKKAQVLIQGFLTINDSNVRREVLALVRALGKPHS